MAAQIKAKLSEMRAELEDERIKREEINMKYKTEAQLRSDAEADVAALNRRIQLLEDDLESTNGRLTTATEMLEEASKAADESERQRKVLEVKSTMDDERIDDLDRTVKQYTIESQDWELKYDEVKRKAVMLEKDLEITEERSLDLTKKVRTYEGQLDTVTNDLKHLELREEKASQREDTYEETIRDLTSRLKEAEHRATEAERTVSKLQKEVDRLEDDLNALNKKYSQLELEYQNTMQELGEM